MFVDELRTVFGRPRTWVLLVLLAAIPVTLAVVLWLTSGGGGGDDGRGPAFFSQVTNNGVFAAVTALGLALGLLLPLMVAVVAGDTIAGEANLGTLRYLLVRPVGRSRLLWTKFAVAVIFAVAAALVIAVAGIVIGAVLFPVGPVTTLSGSTLPLSAGVVRILGCAVVAGLSLVGMCALALFVSVQTSTPVAAMATPVIVVILSEILGTVPQLAPLHPWLMTQQWFTFADLLRTPVRWDGIVENLSVQCGYLVVFGGLAWWRFVRRDVLS